MKKTNRINFYRTMWEAANDQQAKGQAALQEKAAPSGT